MNNENKRLHKISPARAIKGNGFTASAFRKLLSIYVFSFFPYGFKGRIWDLIYHTVPDYCLSFYSEY